MKTKIIRRNYFNKSINLPMILRIETRRKEIINTEIRNLYNDSYLTTRMLNANNMKMVGQSVLKKIPLRKIEIELDTTLGSWLINSIEDDVERNMYLFGIKGFIPFIVSGVIMKGFEQLIKNVITGYEKEK